MKKILFSTILTLAAAGTMTLTTSCEDQLDIEQKGVILSENFYKTDADAEDTQTIPSRENRFNPKAQNIKPKEK